MSFALVPDTDTGNDENVNEDNNQPNLQSELGPSTSRKRSLNKENWAVNKRKLLRNSGKEYSTKTGVRKDGKKFENVDCGCPKKCITFFYRK